MRLFFRALRSFMKPGGLVKVSRCDFGKGEVWGPPRGRGVKPRSPQARVLLELPDCKLIGPLAPCSVAPRLCLPQGEMVLHHGVSPGERVHSH